MAKQHARGEPCDRLRDRLRRIGIGSRLGRQRTDQRFHEGAGDAGCSDVGVDLDELAIGDAAPDQAALEQAQDGRWQLRLWWKPFVTLIWLGGALIAIGGALSLLGRLARGRRAALREAYA